MKAISLWQPWATLIAIGAKKVETRSWHTSYRGTIYIHAAKHWTQEEADTCHDEPFRSVLMRHLGLSSHAPLVYENLLKSQLPFGALIATASLKECLKYGHWVEALSEQERAFGYYAAGRYGWVFENIQPLPKPIPFRGAQGIFDVEVTA